MASTIQMSHSLPVRKETVSWNESLCMAGWIELPQVRVDVGGQLALSDPVILYERSAETKVPPKGEE